MTIAKRLIILLAVPLVAIMGLGDPAATILATDIDADALAVAEAGECNDWVLQELKPERRERFFTEPAAGRWKVAPAVRRLVEFRPLNLAEVAWQVEGPFDVILCRNVLMWSAPVIACAATSSESANRLPHGISV